MSAVVDLTAPGRAAATHFDTAKRPKIGWTQTEDNIAVIVRIPGAKEISVSVKSKSISVQLTGEDGVRYKAVMALTGRVEVKDGSWSSTVRRLSLKVQVTKEAGSKEEWEKLVDLPAKDTKNWLEYDWDAHNEIEVDDVEPDEKEEPDVEPRKKRRPDESDKPKPVETKEEKQTRWVAKQKQLQKEAVELAKQRPVKAAPLQFTCSQLLSLMSFVAVFTAIFTHFATRYFIA